MEGIWAGSDFAGAIVTALGFLGAIVAFILNRKIERKQKIDDERRRAVADLIFAIEGSMAKLRLSARVGISDLPDMDDENIAGQRALSVVRAYGCSCLVEATLDYQRTMTSYKWALIREKRQRKIRLSQIQDGERFSRGETYKGYQEKAACKHDEMICARNKFFDEVAASINTKVSRLEAFAGVETFDPE